ncbi:peptide-methionine (S)-S-oxide reductase [Pseudoalteromonas luteoviolacea]|uniref:peptide-methionine (S)-S-oxide reductase n=1 Tax=Pseudoalteromonas luteoviolacea TaxID=43657 RepID=UPI001F18C591|nr:peptide-methionine (S)-S-oxide reductase [Pseudoalteromonas luteoviolacea]MCF6442505.1 peptide-methionine (S)-S-oxide reductase [Pseudoalteromonas luteoviolacea]
MENKLGLGGSCYWCTEAIFRSLIGVEKVEQGWINSFENNEWFSEGVYLAFDKNIITLADLVEIHLFSHSSASNHSKRDKYRSAIYCQSTEQQTEVKGVLSVLQKQFEQPIVTQALLLNEFKLSPEHYQDYFYTAPNRPFCQNIIAPKLRNLMEKFKSKVKEEQVNKALK